MGVLSSNHTKKKMKAPDLRRHPSRVGGWELKCMRHERARRALRSASTVGYVE